MSDWRAYCAGYEVGRAPDVATHADSAASAAAASAPWRSTALLVGAAGRRPESLATRREAVELLTCDAPLLAYLVQNGAVGRLDAELVEREASSSARQNIALLRCVERGGRAALALLLNALRLTGQHQLANLIDYTPRIVPPPPGVEPASCTPGDALTTANSHRPVASSRRRRCESAITPCCSRRLNCALYLLMNNAF